MPEPTASLTEPIMKMEVPEKLNDFELGLRHVVKSKIQC
jgi:hypothetical protein